MTELYRNEIGKSRPDAADAPEQSRLRQEWWADFEKRLRERLPDSLQSAQIKIVGSVAKNQAAEDSDIDIVITSSSSDPLIVPRMREAIFSLLREMRTNGETTYNLEIQDVSNPLMFSDVAMLQRRQGR